jgi:cytoskeletal protein CcmA (bactofilin family)
MAMRETTARPRKVRLGLFVAGLLLAITQAGAQTPPEPPEPPEPRDSPEVSLKGFTVRPGETHKGDVMRFATSVNIEGTLDGDLYVTAQTIRISGVVTGDVFVAGSQVDVTGEIKKSLRSASGNVVLDGTVGGSVAITGGTLTVGSKAHILENLTAYTGQFTHRGVVDGVLTFTGGVAVIGGEVKDDANITADAIEIEPGAHFDGDVDYSTRKQMDAAIQAVTAGDVSFDEQPIKEKKHKSDDEDSLRPTKFGVGKWIAFFIASLLFGCAMLALFKDHEPKVTAAIQTDTLRSFGIGFVSILVTIAVCLSVILLLTIPFIFIYLLGYIVAAYLAKIPVAIWVGRALSSRVGWSLGPYKSLALGLAVLYLVFMLPVIGILAQIFVALLGLGAMISVYIAHRQARKAAQTVSAMPPQPPPPPAAVAS